MPQGPSSVYLVEFAAWPRPSHGPLRWVLVALLIGEVLIGLGSAGSGRGILRWGWEGSLGEDIFFFFFLGMEDLRGM